MSNAVGISITAWLLLSTYCFVALVVVNPSDRLTPLQRVIMVIGYSGPMAWALISFCGICRLLEKKT